MLEVQGWDAALSEWLEPFLDALGHKARRRWAPVYIRGLFGRTERKSVQPRAADLIPGDYDQRHNVIASRSWASAPLETVLASKADALVGGKGAILERIPTKLVQLAQPIATHLAGINQVGELGICNLIGDRSNRRRCCLSQKG